MTLIERKRPQAEPIPSFVTQLKAYEKRCIEIGVISKDSKRKVDDCEYGNKPAKKRAIGPAAPPPKRVIGPSLPPSVAADKNCGDSETFKVDKVVCGPELPCSARVAARKENAGKEEKRLVKDEDKGEGN